MPRQSKANRRKTKIKQGLRNPNADRNDAPSAKDLKWSRADHRGATGASGKKRKRRPTGASNREAFFSMWLQKGKGSAKRQAAIASVRGGGGGNISSSHKSNNQRDRKRHKRTAIERYSSKAKLTHAERQAELKSAAAAAALMRREDETAEDFQIRNSHHVRTAISSEEMKSTKRASKAKRRSAEYAAKKKRQAATRAQRKSAGYDSEEEEWTRAVGGRDDAQFGERTEDAPRFRHDLSKQRNLRFLKHQKKKVVTLMEGEDGQHSAGGGAGGRSSAEQIEALRARVVANYRQRKGHIVLPAHAAVGVEAMRQQRGLQ